jgi:hypothetical protein
VTGSSPATATLTVSSTAQVSATPPVALPRVPPRFRLPAGWPWLLAALLALATLVSMAAPRRRRASWLFATALLVVGIWAACGGGGGGSGGSSPPAPAPVVSLLPTSTSYK